MTTANVCDKPLAAAGLTSYRYRGRYGWVMIGATDANAALREALRSITGPAYMANLQVYGWNGYEPVQFAVPDCDGCGCVADGDCLCDAQRAGAAA